MQDGWNARGCSGQVRSHAGVDDCPQPGDFAFPRRRHFDIFDVVPAVSGSLIVFRSALCPFDRPS